MNNCVVFILLPNALKRGLVGSILSDIEYNGFKIKETIFKNKLDDNNHNILFNNDLDKKLRVESFIVCFIEKDNALNDFNLLLGNTHKEKTLLGDYCHSQENNDIIYFNHNKLENEKELTMWLEKENIKIVK